MQAKSLLRNKVQICHMREEDGKGGREGGRSETENTGHGQIVISGIIKTNLN